MTWGQHAPGFMLLSHYNYGGRTWWCFQQLHTHTHTQPGSRTGHEFMINHVTLFAGDDQVCYVKVRMIQFGKELWVSAEVSTHSASLLRDIVAELNRGSPATAPINCCNKSGLLWGWRGAAHIHSCSSSPTQMGLTDTTMRDSSHCGRVRTLSRCKHVDQLK